MIEIIMARFIAAVLALSTLFIALPTSAHGERNQEPFLRMRTLHWYDVHWTKADLNVNDEITMTGRFRVFHDWPDVIPKPDTVYLGSGTPGPVLVKTASYLGGVSAIQSTSLEIGRDYEFKTVLKARIPGRHHLHPLLSVQDAGPLVGPGQWVDIKGSAEDFSYSIKTLTGETIEDLETWGFDVVAGWHLMWGAIALFWLLWWLRRPLVIPRYLAIVYGREDVLVTNADRAVAAVLIVVTIGLVVGGYQWAEAKYPRTIPLQGGKVKIEPLPVPPEAVALTLVSANYNVPGRSMMMVLKVTNLTNRPLQLGEFTSANVRFVNAQVAAAIANVDPSYPSEHVNQGLNVDNNRPIAPRESRVLHIDASDVAWEAERLTSFLTDPDSRFGALLFFYDSAGKRHIASVTGPIIPIFM